METSVTIVYVSMALLFIAFSIALKYKIIISAIAAVIVVVGVSCNILVVKSNGGKMPVFIENMSAETKVNLNIASRHQEGTEKTKYAYLADFITTDKTQNIYSPGDISMTIGPVLLALCVLCQIVYTLKYEGFLGFLRNDLPISYSISAMSVYAVYMGCRHVIAYT